MDDARGVPQRALRLTVAGALAGTGVLVNAVSGEGGLVAAVAPAAQPVPWSARLLLPLLVPALAVVLGLALVRWWRWLLLAGALCQAPAVLLQLRATGGVPAVTDLALAGAPLVLIAVLAGAQELVVAGAVGPGAAVAGVAVGAQLAGDILLGARYLRQPPALPQWHALLLVVAVAGGLAAVGARPRRPAPAPAPAAADNPAAPRWWRPALRAGLAGGLAGWLTLVPPVLDDHTLARLLGVHWDALYRRPYAAAGAVGLLLVAVTVLLAALAGGWALAGALTLAAVLVGMTDPLILGEYPVAFHPAFGLAGGLLGVLAGALLGATRWRVSAAAIGALGCGLALLIAYAATGGVPEKLVEQQAALPGAVLLAGLAGTATALAAALAPALGRRGVLPGVLGPVALVMVAGGRAVLRAVELAGAPPTAGYFAGLHHLTISVLLLLVGAALVGGLGVAEVLPARLVRAGPTTV